MNNMQVYYSNKSKLVALLLAFFLGGAGIHRFYLGRKQSGLIMLGLTIIGALADGSWLGGALSVVVTCWVIVDLVALCIGKLTDAYGRPLRFKN